MIDQLIINNVASFDDFGASLKSRQAKAPKKKSIRESVPFSNITHDFSAINGEVYWEDAEISYTFEIIAPTPEELERKKIAFKAWVMNIANANIYDPFTPDYHYKGTFDSIDIADEESVEKSTITVNFLCYPYQIANETTVYNFTVEAGAEITANILNNSAHQITPTVLTDALFVLTLDNSSYALPIGEVKDNIFKLSAGLNTLTIQNTSETTGKITIKFYGEVF